LTPGLTRASLPGWRRARVRIRFLFKNLRHRSREYLGWLLARLLGKRDYASSLALEEVSTVLICRINGRIGNTLFLTPLIRYLHQLLPHAAIDLALAASGAAELLAWPAGGTPDHRVSAPASRNASDATWGRCAACAPAATTWRSTRPSSPPAAA
jgi:hypothetical protein